MDQLPTCSPTARVVTLIHLPNEILEAILLQLEDTRSLEAVAGSCRFLRGLLMRHPNLVVQRVLERIIPRDVLPEALAVYKSSSLSKTNIAVVECCLQDYFASLKHFAYRCSLKEAAVLERFHRCVEIFSAKFIDRALCKNPVTGSPEQCDIPPSWRELARIQRALYRFELYCNLFGPIEPHKDPYRPRRPVTPLDEQVKLFFLHFASWENEQLGCIHDFLLRIVDEPFNDVAGHEVDWGEIGINFLLGYEAGEVEGYRRHYLSLGLRFILRLDKTKCYADRLRLLDEFQEVRAEFLDNALLKSNMSCRISGDRTRLAEYTEERIRRQVRSPAIDDGDPGPAQVWGITHAQMAGCDFVVSDAHIPLRERGYVMWDHDRLQNWGLLKVPWQKPPVSYDRGKAYQKVRRSLDRRSEIWLKGGSGWWSEDDESKVVYRKNFYKT